MYNCTHCDKSETLYFECSTCNKKLCRKCVAPNKHNCSTQTNNKPYELDIFCKNYDCIENKNLELCKYCRKNFCSQHLIKHKCKVKSCCIM